MSKLLFSLLTILVWLTICTAKSSKGDRTLVILDKDIDQNDYSQFWKSLEDREYSLTFKSSQDRTLKLFQDDEKLFDHVILFAPKTKRYEGGITAKVLVDFIKQEGNILFVASPELSEPNREFAREFEIEFDEVETFAIDHFQFDKTDDGKHILIVADNLINNKYILSEETRKGSPLLYRGLAHAFGQSPLLTPVVTGSPTSYSYEIKEDQRVDAEPLAVGSKLGLVSAFQAKNNARITFIGSLEFFSNKFFDSKVEKAIEGIKFTKSGNANFAKDITKWTFQESGVIKYSNIYHHLENEVVSRDLYRVKDNLTYEIDISQYNGEKWVPFISNDVQLEFTMLDPFVRTFLSPGVKKGKPDHATYKTTFKIPDRHGIFTFRVNYKRNGLSYVETRTLASIRPYNHNEYPRFLVVAYPYYAGAASTIVTFIIFSVVYLFHKDTKLAAKATEKKNK